MPRNHGFTLIELLIVVAIIGILAAIAIPNFLEAQTRAKYARARADTRSIATALETYQVDYGVYPVGGQFTPNPPETQWQRLVPLTTPIQYLTSLPIDIFDEDTGTIADNFTLSGSGNDPYNYENLVNNPDCGGPFTAASEPYPGARYKILTPGIARQPFEILWNRPYDPSNGTISLGVVGFTSKGEMDGFTFNFSTACAG